MKKYLLPNDCKAYKANLHCHSTFSDGRFDVEKLKEIYKSHGYSVVAFSDHNVLIPHPELEDPDFIPLTAIEIDVDHRNGKSNHLNFYSVDKAKSQFPPFERVYGLESINRLIEIGNENGFLVQYNHPRWSFQDTEFYGKLKGLWGFEVFNTGCEVEMNDGWGDYEYEVMCRDGKEYLAVVADDDNHNGPGSIESPNNDSFGGWTMIFAPELSYDGIINAMKRCDLYASTGPEIKALYVENDRVYIECSPSCSVVIRFETRRSGCKLSNADDITFADFDISGDYEHFRLEVKDKYGNKAMTKAYTKKDL